MYAQIKIRKDEIKYADRYSGIPAPLGMSCALAVVHAPHFKEN